MHENRRAGQVGRLMFEPEKQSWCVACISRGPVGYLNRNSIEKRQESEARLWMRDLVADCHFATVLVAGLLLKSLAEIWPRSQCRICYLVMLGKAPYFSFW